jgi:6-phosphogluconolactonase
MTEPSISAQKPGNVTVVADSSALYRTAAAEFSRCAREAIAAGGRFSVALSGGNTPHGVYSLLAAEQGKALPWNRIFVFFGDERHVPPDHPDSNYRMANETLLSKVPIPPQNVFRVPAELPADAAAAQYEQSVREFFNLRDNTWPNFDLVLLGLGDDGHTASLFPGTAALQETSRLVVANWVEKFQSYRITFTYPVLNHAVEALFLVSGEGKAQILKSVLAPAEPKTYPAQAVQPQAGIVMWLVDREAARLLE